MTSIASSPRLRRLARRPVPEPAATAAVEERCELCGEGLSARHRHVLEVDRDELRCACRPCGLLFERPEAGAGRHRLVPERRLRLTAFALDDALWRRLAIPVGIAFFRRRRAAGRTVAYYPGPAGATESTLDLADWSEIERTNPVLATLEEEVEALLVNRARGASSHWVVPIDECYALVGCIRTHWRGFGGGKEAWQRVDDFFAELARRARSVDRGGSFS